VGGISEDEYAELKDPENNSPLLNRAIMSFPPGSAIKIVPAYGGLAEGIISERSTFYCAGAWTGLGENFIKYCWNRSGHGSLNIRGAIKNSCDIYFYQVGYGLLLKNDNSEELLQKYLRIFGFGSVTGIDLPSEDPGLVPDKEWKKDYFKDQPEYTVWFPGDTVNMAIGQGYLLVTPLQLAQAYSILANRGLEYKPYLAEEIKDSEGNLFPDSSEDDYQDLNLDENFIEIIEDGMVQVVSPGGTAASVFSDFPLDIYPIAGKTGTAESPPKQDYAWFASYAPVGNTQYVVVAMLEEAGSGGSNVSPMIEKIYRYLFTID